MTGKHRVVGERAKRLAVVGAATATVTALTVGAAAPQPVQTRPDLRLVHDQPLHLTASTSLFPKPGVLPDITGGLGNTVYNNAQDLYATIAKALVGRVSVPALTGGLHVNIGDVLNQIPLDLLDQVLGAVKIDLGSLLDGALPPGVSNALVAVLDLLNITDSAGNVSLSGLLGLIGLDVSNIVDLANLDIPGVRVITPGPTFGLLKLLGVDIGWTPGTPNAVAEAINSTPYLDISGDGLLDIVFKQAKDALDVLGPIVGGTLQVAVNLLHAVTDALPLELLDVTDVRIPIVAGIGLGAFSTGASYSKILSELGFQPGGTKSSQHPLVGGFTILPMVLLNNLGRANGGLLSRFYPLGDLLGIDLLTPETSAVHSGGLPLLNTGLAVGGANLVPIKIDATAEYQPFSDFAAWPNPFSLANNLLAGTVGATYILRGLTLDTILEQVGDAVGDAAGNIAAGNPVSLNIYLTLPAKTLPLLEPLYLTGDVLNAVSFGTLGTFPIRLANALAPALTSLVNLGYTDVERNPDGTYTRTLTDADTPTPFMTFPHVNPQQVANDVIRSLVKGFQKEFFSGHPTAAPPNIVNELVKVVKSITSGSFAKQLTKTAGDAVTSGLAEANALPAAAARTLTVATDQVTKSGDTKKASTEESTGKHAAPDDAPVPADSGSEPRHAKSDDTTKVDTTKVDDKKDDSKKGDNKKADTAKADKTEKPTVKKHDPLTNAVHEITRAFTPKKKPTGSESKDAGTAKENAEASSAGEAA